MADTANSYAEQLRRWAIYTAAVVGLMVVQALVTRFIGPPPQPLPAPPPPDPQIVLVTAEGSPGIKVTVVRPEKSP